MSIELLSQKRLGLWHKAFRSKKVKWHYEYGYKPEKELPYSDMPYMRNGKKVVRIYHSGIGFQQVHKIYELR